MDTNSGINELKIGGISSDFLKYVAILAMLIDHIGYVVLGQYLITLKSMPDYDYDFFMKVYHFMYFIRLIGRIAFPIFCYQLVVGFFRTTNRKKYGLSLLAFAFISEPAFDLASEGKFLYLKEQNVFFELLLGYIVIWALDTLRNKADNVALQAIVVVLGLIVAHYINSDYDVPGIILIVSIYYLYGNYELMYTVPAVIFLCVYFVNAFFEEGQNINRCLDRTLFESASVLAMPIIMLDNGIRRIKGKVKYAFYAFYPCHLLILSAIRYALFGK